VPSISIIVPIFDGIRYLPYFLKSLAEAAPPNADLILVDDGSAEPVFEVVPDGLPFSSITKLRNDRNRGYSAAVNRGFACANGDIVVQLNTDLILDPRCIEAMVEMITKTPNAGIIGSKQLFPTTGLLRNIGVAFGKHTIRHIYSGMPAEHPLCRKTRKMQLVSGATAAMTRRVLDAIGPLDERYYNTLENFDHCLKAHAHGYVNYTCADSVTYHWVSQSGPARFARVEEDEALFWGEWTPSRSIDLGDFVDEAFDHILNSHPELLRFQFEPLSLCRSGDESILFECLEKKWKGASSRTHHTRVFNSSQAKLWLPMELPHRAMTNPAPYIYLVDQISQLSENRLWFEARSRVVKSELVVDANAAVLTTRELLALNGEPLR
jgi:GT2 family glycosyltransferase